MTTQPATRPRRRRQAAGRSSPRAHEHAQLVDGLLGRPRVVVVTRPTAYQLLLARHGTREQVRFFLATRGQTLDETEARQRNFDSARRALFAAIPSSWRQTSIERSDLHRFCFEPSDLVVALGQDGLVANVAKYLDGQPVIGLDGEPGRNAGVLVRHRVEDSADLLHAAASGRARIQPRTMVDVELDDGQRLLALNELFIGHPRHQSACYRLRCGSRAERQSSSGVVVSTGTGATGWAQSIAHGRGLGRRELPRVDEPKLVFFVREAWLSPQTQTQLTLGFVTPDHPLELSSELEDGVVFGDGIEDDRLDFGWGRRAVIRIAATRLSLVVG